MKKYLLSRMGGGAYVLTAALLFFSGSISLQAQSLPPTAAPSQVDQTDAVTGSLNRSSMRTNILYDRVSPLADLGAYTGVAGGESSKSEHFFQSYYELYNASYNRSGMLDNEQLRNQVAASSGASTYPIGIIYYNYDEITKTAVQDNLIRYENGSFYDVSGRPRGPYQLQKAVVASPLLHQNAPFYKPGWVTFKLDPAFFLTNTGTSLQYCQIDFGDGSGLRTIYPNNSVQVYYGSPGQRSLDIRVFISNGQQLQAYASVTVVESSFGDKPYADWNDNEICNQTPVSFEVTGDAFNPSQYPSGGSVYGAKGTATIFFARGNCASKVLRKPIIFLDGFDPTNARDYKAIYKDYINDEDVRENNGSNLKLGDKLRNEGYDIVVLDYEDSGDYIERNGLMVQKLLQELWVRYSSTIEQDFVIIGPSMGALVGQYALANVERQRINHHTRLYISFDGPHRGANIPIGLQQMVGYGLRSKLAEPTLGNRCRSGTSGIVEDDFALNIRSAKQMLLHHYLANSETPAPHPYRDIFMRNLRDVGYPQNCRKIAVINGSRRGITQRAGSSSTNLNRDLQPSEDILRLVVESKAANFGLTSDKTFLAWGTTAAPINNRGNTFHAFTSSLVKKLVGVPDKIHDDYARPYTFAPDKSLDLIPGGHSNTMERIVRAVSDQKEISNSVACIYLGRIQTQFFDFRFLYNLSITLKQGRNYFATSNTPVHSFVPTISSVDLRNPVDFSDQNTLSYNFDNENLVCSGKTPFNHIYAPAENQAHVAITPENAGWFENEIKRQNLPAGCVGSCDLAITANSVNVGCSQQVTLAATCSGANCDNISFAWSGNGLSQNGQTITFNAPGGNGNYTYTVTASRSGCSDKTGTGTVNVSGCGGGTAAPLSGCYVIKSQKTGQSLQAMSDGSIKQQGGNGQTNQIWRAEDVGNSQFRFTTQNGNGQVIRANSGTNYGEQLSLGGYTGDDREKWSVQQNGSTGNYRVYRSNNITWDLNNYGNNPELQLWGNTSEPFYDYRSFRFESTGCPGGGTPPTNPPAPPTSTAGVCTPFGEQCSGNNQEVRSVNINANTAGNFALTLTYKSHERDVDGVVRVNGVDQSVRFSKTQPGAYATVTTTAVPINQGSNNVVEFRSQAGGGYLCLKEICVGSGGSTTPPPPPPPTGGGGCAASINSVNYNWDGGNNSISFTVNSPAGNPQIKLSGPTSTDWLGTFDFGNSVWYQAVVGVATGNYTVSVRPAGDGGAGCSLSFSVPGAGGRLYPAGARLGAAGTGDEADAGTLVLMPNPSKGPVTVRFRLGSGEPGRLWVVNLRGGVVAERSVVGTGVEQRERLELEGMSAGVYLVRLQGEGTGTQAGKLVLER